MDTSTPRSKAPNATPAPQVLSKAVITRRWAERPTLAAWTTATKPGTSGYSRVIDPGTSSHTKRVALESLAAKSAGSMGLYRRWVMPH